MKELFVALNLIYYEFDESLQTLFLDKKYIKESAVELVSITHLLQQKKIEYFIDKEHNIHLIKKPTLLQNLVYNLALFFGKKEHKYNIFVCNNKSVHFTKNLPLIDINIIKKEIDLSLYDAVVFTSQNGVKAINHLNPLWRHKPSYVLAPQTAKTVKSLKGQLRYVSKTHYSHSFAHELKDFAKNKKLLYLRAKDVAFDLKKSLEQFEIMCDEEVIYETVCREVLDVSLPKHSIVIFSSPSTVRCFFKNSSWDDTYTAIAIGETTAKSLPTYIHPYIAGTTSIDSCVRKALEVLKL